MAAGIPKEVPAATINMVCGSGLRSIVMGYQAICCGDASIVVAGGQESMSQVGKLVTYTRIILTVILHCRLLTVFR